jgi:hypothetical protein
MASQPTADRQQQPAKPQQPAKRSQIRRFWLSLWGLSEAPHEQKLLEDYWQTLKTRLIQFQVRRASQDERKQQFLEHLEQVLTPTKRGKEEPNWDDTFAADKLIPQLLEGKEIDLDFMSRQEEAKTEWPRNAKNLIEEYGQRWEKLLADPKSTEEDKRTLLQGLTNEGWWQFAILRQEREYRTNTINFSMRLFLISLVALFLAFWSVDREVLDVQSWLGSWWIVALAGLAGASFSWLTGLRSSIREKDLDALKELSRPTYSILRLCIGVGGALVLYCALRGGFISGAIFPTLDVTQSEERLTKVTQAFRAIVKAETSCGPAEQDKNREALITSAVENFKSQLLIHVKDRKAVLTDGDWIRAAGVQRREGQTGSGANASMLTLCTQMPAARTISSALLPQPGTLALLLFWSFVAGFSEKLVPGILDSADKGVTR